MYGMLKMDKMDKLQEKINCAYAPCEYLILKALQCNFSKCIGAMISFLQQTNTFLSTYALKKFSLKLSDLLQ